MSILEKDIFGLSIKQYIKRFIYYEVLLVILYTLVKILLFLLSIIPASHRVTELSSALHHILTIGYILISFFISKKIYSKYSDYKGLIFGQGLVVGTGSGLILSILNSFLGFIFCILSLKDISDLIRGIVELISFLWTVWTYIFIFTALIDGIIGILWLINNYSSIKSKLSEIANEDDKTKPEK